MKNRQRKKQLRAKTAQKLRELHLKQQQLKQVKTDLLTLQNVCKTVAKTLPVAATCQLATSNSKLCKIQPTLVLDKLAICGSITAAGK